MKKLCRMCPSVRSDGHLVHLLEGQENVIYRLLIEKEEGRN